MNFENLKNRQIKQIRFSGKLICIAAVLALVIGLIPAFSFAADDSLSSNVAGQRSEEEINSMVSAMLAAGDYEEGEAIVCFTNAQSTNRFKLFALRGEAEETEEDLFANAEKLSEVDRQQYAEATGQVVPESAVTELKSMRLMGNQADSQTDNQTNSQASALVEILIVRKYDMSTEQLLTELLRDPRVLSAEPNYIMYFSDDGDEPVSDPDLDPEGAQPSEPEIDPEPVLEPESESDTKVDVRSGSASPDFTNYQWFSTGVDSTVPQYLNATNPGVNAPDWNTPGATNADGVVVIMDSGVDYNHPDLANVMYHFSADLQEQLGCGEFGYAPIRDDKTDPMDGVGHGTHCAGIVAAEWNDFGVSGIANGTQLVAVSVSRGVDNPSFSYDSLIKSYDFVIRAAEAGVPIYAINRSLECGPTNNANQAMVYAAGELGVVTCVATGNSRRDLDIDRDDTGMYQTNPYYLRVDAASLQDDLASFSNYGKHTTDVFAPGVAILSTMPSYNDSFSYYFPDADDDPLYLKTNFDDGLLDVAPASTEEPNPIIRGTEKGTIGVDADGNSQAIDVTVYSERGCDFFIDVPVDSLNKDDVQDISVALHSSDSEVRELMLSILLEDGSYTEYELENTCSPSPCGWGFVSAHVSDPQAIGQDFGYVTDSHGRTCIRLQINSSVTKVSGSEGETFDTTLYIDQIAIGKPGNDGFLPYGYMSGTSMATPCVVGCAAIVSSRLQELAPAERAAQTVLTLKSAVRQADGYYGLCQQNGQIDLSLLDGGEALVPALESAQVSGETLVVEGVHFGDGGALYIGTVEAQMISWSDGRIEAQWPDGLVSGLIPLTVKNDAGEARRAFILQAPESVENDVLLYERDLASVSPYGTKPGIVDAPDSVAATDDGVLFVAAPNLDDRSDATIRYVMRSDDQGGSWTSIELPQDLKLVSLATGNGKLFMCGATPADDPATIQYWHLYSLDVSAGTSFELVRSYDYYGSDLNAIGSLAFAGGNLYYVDCYADPDDPDSPTHARIRCFTDDYSLDNDNALLLGHDYPHSALYAGPEVATSGSSIYLCGLELNRDYESDGQCFDGLERVDIGSDGSMTVTDLSAALQSLNVGADHVCIAACDVGLFLIGEDLDALLPEGATRTDTFLLEAGGTSFQPYNRTLSYAPLFYPAAACSNGWLYAFASSRYEDSPQFGRATRVAYTIRFVDEDGTELQNVSVRPGEVPEYTGETPTKDATAEYTYAFAGWTPDIVPATEDAIYTATYEATPIPPEPAEQATLTFDLAGGSLNGQTGIITITANVGETVKLLAAPTRGGYTFKYWKGSEYAAEAEYTVPEGGHKFTAVWEQEPGGNGDDGKGSDDGGSGNKSDNGTGASSKDSFANTGDPMRPMTVALVAVAALACAVLPVARRRMR